MVKLAAAPLFTNKPEKVLPKKTLSEIAARPPEMATPNTLFSQREVSILTFAVVGSSASRPASPLSRDTVSEAHLKRPAVAGTGVSRVKGNERTATSKPRSISPTKRDQIGVTNSVESHP